MSSYAVIIGINHYTPIKDQGLKPLQGAINDANDMYQWITTKGGVPSANCHLIPSKANPLNPIKDDIDNALIKIGKSVIQNDNKDADRLYFYYAGHGLAVELDRENNGLCMANWSEWNADSASLALKDYKQKFLNEGLFKEIVMWLDCCRNTKTSYKPQGVARMVGIGPNTNPKWLVGYATQSDNPAFEANTAPNLNAEPRGIFTSVLLDGLNGGISQNGGSIYTSDLCDHMYFHVPKMAQQAGFTQIPEMSHNTTKYNSILF